VDDLLLLSTSRPREALARARAVLSGRPDAYDASVAHQVAGIVMREFGDVDAGVREARAALRLARQVGSAEREADVSATLGIALVYAGRTAAGLAEFNRALARASGVMAGRVLVRRGMALWEVGRNAAALADYHKAITVLRRADDVLWTARALNGRAVVYWSLGSVRRADADFGAAELLYAGTSQELESVYMMHNRGCFAFSAGDLPAALSYLDQAAARYRSLNLSVPALGTDRCAVLLAAGLAGDALTCADAAVRDIQQRRGRATMKAELLLTAARCALAAAQPQAAIERAQAAHRLFRSQQSAWWQAQTATVLGQAKYAAGQVSARLLREASLAAARLEALGSGDAAQAHLLAGRVAYALGRQQDADRHLGAAARSRQRGPALSRASGWLGEALRAQASQDPRRMLAACGKGLRVLEEHQFTLGASELRAQATAHGAELAGIAQRYAAEARRPRLLLSWSERWRGTALAVPAVRPPADAQLAADLTKLRDVTKRLEQAQREVTEHAPAHREQLQLERERQRLEGAVRDRALHAHGVTWRRHAPVSIPALLEQLGAVRLIEIVDIDGVLHVLACGGGKVRQFTAGRAEDAARAADFARFALRRLARSRPGDDLDSALAVLKAVAPKLQDALVGDACRHLGDGPVVIVPPGKLHAIPWALIPALRDRVVTVAPSAGAWLRARDTRPPSRRQVTFVRGPGLASDGAEIPAIARLYDDAVVLGDGEAASASVLRALDGAWLAHVAAHGVFRADSPLFSSLRMQDGPLTVYDLEQLRRAPHRLILSSCDSGVAAAAGADELLGLVSSLLPLGTAGIIAAVAPLNDEAVVPVMVDLHQCLRAGKTFAESMLGVRSRSAGDPIREATAMSLVALGAG
jgi:tetratricopeptide (TPR) repeat protein